MKLVVLLELSATALLMLPWAAQGATFRWARTSNRIYVENGGSATLSDIKAALTNAPLDLVDPVNRVWLLRANLQIADGSVLVLHGAAAGGDVNEFRLQSNNSSASNSFVSITADWGVIDIKNVRITSWDLAANGPDTEFQTFGRAFIRVRSRLAADGITPNESRMDILESDISYLGYDAPESYGLAWKVSGAHPDPNKSIFDYVNVYGDIIGSRLHHNFWGVYSYGMEGARWLNNEVDHNAGYGFDPHDDSDHLLIEGNNVHHNGGLGRGVHGIIASKRCDHLVIRNNRSWANAENGIMLHRHCDDAVVENNVTFLNGDSGIALFDSDRITVRNNLVLSNANAGIRLSVGCADNVITGNEIAYSGGNGFYFYPGTDPAEPDPVDPTVTNRSRRNTMASNTVHHCTAEGIKMTDGDENVLIGNDFSANARELFFLTSTKTRFIGNSIPATAIVALFGTASEPTATFFEQQPLVTLALSNAYVSATFEDDDGAVFAVGQSSVATRVDNQHSFVTLTTAEVGVGATVTTRDLFVGLNTGEALISVTPTLWGSGGDLRKQWTSQATTATASIHYTVADLSPNRPYTVLKNGQPLSSVASDSNGQVSFTDVPGTTAAVQYAIAPGGSPPPLPTVTVVDSDGNASESGANAGSFSVTRTGSTASALTVRYSLGGSAANGADFSTLPGSVNIPAGSSSATIIVNTIDDSAVEGSENVVLTLSADAAYVIGSPNSAVVDMEDNDREPRRLPRVTIRATDPNASESAPNQGAFTVSRTGSTTAALTVQYSVSGTAARGLDYAALPGSVNIPAGSASASVTITPVDDSVNEGNETVVLALSPNSAYTVGSRSKATVIIADNDQPPTRPTVTVVDSDGNAAESGANTGSFTVTRTGSTGSALTVRYSLSGSAANGADYSTLSGSVNIPAGSASATVVVNTIDDSAVEGDENVVLTLSSDAAYVIGSPNSATVDMEDNDREPPTVKPVVGVSATDIVCSESGPNPGTLTISRSGTTASDLIVRYGLGGTAVNGTDYVRLSGSVTIPAGNESASVVVQPIDDRSIELAELVTLTLVADSAYDVNGLLGTAALTILDNDLIGLDSATSLAPVLVVFPSARSVTDGRLTLAWEGTAGQRYQLQYKSNWNATNWVDLGGIISSASNGTVIASDAIGSDPQRFYRVVLLP